MAGNDAFIKGTRIEAHRIAALLDGGMTVQGVLGDYPSLSESQVLAAHAYAATRRNPGRPYPTKTAKGALTCVDLGHLDEL